jgi:hypothetical protein
MTRLGFAASALSVFLITSQVALADPPCDRYPSIRQKRCKTIWKQINAETESEVAKFGMDQLKRRQEGRITAEQHLQENTAFIKQSAERRLKLLHERMTKE